MSTLSRPRDTAPESWNFQLDCYRAMSGARRAQQVIWATEIIHQVSASRDTLVAKDSLLQPKPFDKLFADVITTLDLCDIPYMIVGSFASAYHGIPRSTEDLDIVVALDLVNLKPLLARLSESSYYVSSAAAAEAVKHETQFNLIDSGSGWKIDFITRKSQDFSLTEFERRQKALIQGQLVAIATAEDTILAKLQWAKDSLSERQLRDIAGILDICGDKLDRDYLEAWLDKLDLRDVMAKAAGPW